MINCTWSYHACVQYKWQPSALVGADILTQNRTSRKRRSRKRVLPAQAGEAAEVIVEGAEGEAVAAACAVLDGEGGQMSGRPHRRKAKVIEFAHGALVHYAGRVKTFGGLMDRSH
jgi:hypothetical protein